MINHCGFKSVVEKKNVFNDGLDVSHKKPDISVLGLNIQAEKMLLDVGITSPISVNSAITPSMNNAICPHSAANLYFQAKKVKYQDQVNKAGNLEFLPLIFEITGACHREALAFIKKIAKTGAALFQKRFEALIYYWKSVICVTLQKYIARGIFDRYTSSIGSRNEVCVRDGRSLSRFILIS